MAWQNRGSGRLGARRIRQVCRDAEALRRRQRGEGYGDIAEAMGYGSESGPRKAVQRALARCSCVDRPLHARVAYWDLERLHEALWPLAEDGDVAAGKRLLRIYDLHTKLMGNFKVDLPALKRRSPPRVTEQWTEPLDMRANGATLDEIAHACGLRDRSAARKRVERDLAAYVDLEASVYLDSMLEHYDWLFWQAWDDAIADPPKLSAVDRVLTVINKRIALLGLAPPEPPPEPIEAEFADGMIIVGPGWPPEFV